MKKLIDLFFLVMFLLLVTGCEKTGLDGKKSLIVMEDIAPGENCSSGGVKLTSGLDLNDNSLLDSNEVQYTNYVCNGNNGLFSLIDILSEPEGLNCSSGGYKINSGIDQNKNNVLDETEIQYTQYICHGDDGGYDKQILIPFIGGTGAFTSSTAGVIAERDELIGFNITNYIDADSIVFGIYITTTDQQGECIVELFDKTNNRSINNTRLTTNATTTVWTTTTVNFIDDLPMETIDLGFYIRSGKQGITVGGLSPALIIYRK